MLESTGTLIFRTASLYLLQSFCCDPENDNVVGTVTISFLLSHLLNWLLLEHIIFAHVFKKFLAYYEC